MKKVQPQVPQIVGPANPMSKKGSPLCKFMFSNLQCEARSPFCRMFNKLNLQSRVVSHFVSCLNKVDIKMVNEAAHLNSFKMHPHMKARKKPCIAIFR